MCKIIFTGVVSALLLTACAAMMSDSEYAKRATAVMHSSFQPRGQASVDRLNQDEMQRLCSEYVGEKRLPKELAEKIEKEQAAQLKYPTDGQLMGDWKAGEKVAQAGVGMQFSDAKGSTAGGNCYACHQLAPQELAFGTIGPSLYQFGKLRGHTPEMQKYAYGKIYNAQAFNACSNMPRFGHNGVLTEQQIKDLVALLMDPNSPVNK